MLENAVLTSETGIGIRSSANINQFITLNGDVFAVTGIELGTSTSATNLGLTVASTATVQGLTGVKSRGMNRISNDGVIQGHDTGLDVSGGTSSTFITNHGTVSGGLHAIKDAGLGVRLINDGIVESSSFAFQGISAGNDSIINRGTMTGVIDTGFGSDTLDLRNGTVNGAINLGSGVDTYDGRGALVTGAINGGSENDLFILGANDENINGSTGFDTIDFRSLGAASVFLANGTQNAGSAAGDTYSAIENIAGSNTADTFSGNALINVIEGRGGNDKIFGKSGDDTITGGLGEDTLAGGRGNDKYRYLDESEGGDIIRGFFSTTTHRDVIQISKAGFDLSLLTGVLAGQHLISRTDNLAWTRTTISSINSQPESYGLTRMAVTTPAPRSYS